MIWKVATCAAALLVGTTAALAHAHLVKATPKADSTLSSAPAEVVLQFNETLEGAFSWVRVRNASGQQVNKQAARVEKSSPTVIRVSLPALKAGSYTVQWRATATDLHKIDGAFSFRIAD